MSFSLPVRTLMSAGPAEVPLRVLKALARPTIGHLDPFFLEMMEEIKALLGYSFQTDNLMTFVVSGPGSAGMESCFVNLVEPGDEVIVCINGFFGHRMQENVERLGGKPILVEDEWGTPVSLEKVESALKSHPDAKLVSFVHAETSTGTRSDAKAICRLARQHQCLTIVDVVTSLGGIEVRVDEWEMDAVYSASQKCLSSVPGLAPVTFSERALKKITSRNTPVSSWMFDLNLVMDYWNKGGIDGKKMMRSYHHTAPINSLYALHEALVLLKKEGLESAWNRHQEKGRLLCEGLGDMGIDYVVDEPHRLPMLHLICIPEGVGDLEVRQKLLNDDHLEIGGGLGKFTSTHWRIGVMGSGASTENVTICLDALKKNL